MNRYSWGRRIESEEQKRKIEMLLRHIWRWMWTSFRSFPWDKWWFMVVMTVLAMVVVFMRKKKWKGRKEKEEEDASEVLRKEKWKLFGVFRKESGDPWWWWWSQPWLWYSWGGGGRRRTEKRDHPWDHGSVERKLLKRRRLSMVPHKKKETTLVFTQLNNLLKTSKMKIHHNANSYDT